MSIMSSKMDLLSEVLKYDYIRFSICDIQGNCRGVVKPQRHAVKSLENGVDMFQGVIPYGSETEIHILPYKKSYNEGNMVIMPDLDTFHPIPWAGDGQYKVGEFLCESMWKEDGSPQECCPRYVARQQLKRLDDLGLQLFSGFEMEYVLCDANTHLPVISVNDYMSHTVQNRFSSLLFKSDQMFKTSGIDIGAMHLESAPGQFEAALCPNYGIESADAAVNFKQGIFELTESLNLRATFMTKLDPKSFSNAMHFNHSIQSKSASSTAEYLLYDPISDDKLSATAKRWIAGILKHSRALTALCLPTTNCYRKNPEIVSPTNIFWGIEDREAVVRVKNHSPSDTYIENRLPSGLCNPYIVMAATVAAGLDGIINKLECPPTGTRKDSEPLPETLTEALEALESDTELVTALGKEFVKWFVISRTSELRHFDNLESESVKIALERKRYF